jgi:catechol 2,3-dioxygenase-like lactoylglutathione lyase family enzyme
MIKGLCNITFPVSDLKQTVDFYEKILGLKKRFEGSAIVIYDCGIELAFEPGGAKGKKEDHPYIFLEVANVDAEYRELMDKGVEFSSAPKDEQWGGRTASFSDPDGNKVVLVQFKTK